MGLVANRTKEIVMGQVHVIHSLADLIRLEAELRRSCQGGPEGYAYVSMNDFLARHAKAYKARRLPREYGRGVMGGCFWNSYSLARDHPELTYCEGVACAGMIFNYNHHAWCIDRDEKVVDVTWPVGERDFARVKDCGYFGVAFPMEVARAMRALHAKGQFSVFDEPRHKFPMFHRPYDPERTLEYLRSLR